MTKQTKLPEKERQKCEIWTRIMGYFQPLSSFNAGKKSEFYERQYFSEDKATAQCEEAKTKDETQYEAPNETRH